MRVGHPTSVHESMEFRVGGPGVAHMLLLSAADGRALTLECPDEAAFLSVVLGDLGIVPLHHAGDIRVPAFAETFQDAAVGVGVEGGHGS